MKYRRGQVRKENRGYAVKIYTCILTQDNEKVAKLYADTPEKCSKLAHGIMAYLKLLEKQEKRRESSSI